VSKEPDGSKLININLIIADRPYPLKIKAKEEEMVRKAARQINDQIKQYQLQYAAKDKQDYLAMCVLMYAVKAMKSEEKVVIHDSTFSEKLRELDQILGDFLERHQ